MTQNGPAAPIQAPPPGRHSAGHSAPQPRGARGPRRCAQDQASDALPPERRLWGLQETARYLGVSPWTVRELVWRGDLAPVRLPRVRRLLFDRGDLERLIEASKRG